MEKFQNRQVLKPKRAGKSFCLSLWYWLWSEIIVTDIWAKILRNIKTFVGRNVCPLASDEGGWLKWGCHINSARWEYGSAGGHLRERLAKHDLLVQIRIPLKLCEPVALKLLLWFRERPTFPQKDDFWGNFRPLPSLPPIPGGKVLQFFEERWTLALLGIAFPLVWTLWH